MFCATTTAPDETERLGALLGTLAGPGDYVSLIGDLGAGKTCFARGVARGVGVDPRVPITSPTFTLLNIHQGRIPLYHFDLYRLAGDADVDELGFGDYFSGDGLSLVEWAERLADELPGERLEVLFSHQDDTTRRLEFRAVGTRYERLLDQLEQACRGNH